MSRHVLLLGALALVGLVACARDDVELAESSTAGNVERAKRAFRRFGCGSCHEVHGDLTSQGHAGAALEHFASRPSSLARAHVRNAARGPPLPLAAARSPR